MEKFPCTLLVEVLNGVATLKNRLAIPQKVTTQWEPASLPAHCETHWALRTEGAVPGAFLWVFIYPIWKIADELSFSSNHLTHKVGLNSSLRPFSIGWI